MIILQHLHGRFYVFSILSKNKTRFRLNICRLIFTCIVLTALAVKVQAQDESSTDRIKTGWTFGILPSIAFDTDIGFQYGGLVNLYYYGDGSRYPEYDHSLYLEVSRTTRGTGINRFFYDSDRLIKGIRVSADLSYLTERAMNFYGFNGYQARYNREWEDDEDPAYKTRVFYRHDRKMFRLKLDLTGKLAGLYLKWIGGVAYYNYTTGSVDIDRLNKNKPEDEVLPDTAGLYDEYVAWGIIPGNAVNGGSNFYLKLGLMFDTRDQRANPMKGLWTEAALLFAPSFIANDQYAHIKLGITHRQYFTIIPEDLSFAYRLGYQTTIAGTAPWYIQPLMMTSYLTGANSQGLGGSKSLRGILRNRIVGDGFAYGNFEFRWKFIHTSIFKQNLYIALNTFIDAGIITSDIEVDKSKAGDRMNDYFDQEGDGIHTSYGAGLRFALNRNFILAADYGRAFDKRDGISGLYINLNYLF